MSFPSNNEVALQDFVDELGQIIKIAPYHSFGRMLSEFQDRTAQDIYFMTNLDFIKKLKKFIDKEIKHDK